MRLSKPVNRTARVGIHMDEQDEALKISTLKSQLSNLEAQPGMAFAGRTAP
jgi:hypothetical protein